MKKKRSVTLVGSICLIFVFAVVSVMAACATPAPKPAPTPAPTPAPKPAPAPKPKAEPIVLKVVTMFPEGHGSAAGWRMYQEALNEAANGELILEFAGGPEAIGRYEQPVAVQSGAVFGNMTVTAYYVSLLPEGDIWHLSHLTPWEERESGFHELMVELHKEQNMYYLGRQLTNSPFNMFTNLNTNGPYDLSGLKFRSGRIYEPFMRELGIVPVSTSIGEAYSALERGLVDAVAFTSSSAISFSMFEVAKYITGPPFYGAQNGVMILNLDMWNGLPKHLQDLMIDVQKKVERDIVDYFGDQYNQNIQKLLGEGMELNEWSSADTTWFLNMLDRVSWEAAEKNLGRDKVTRLREMLIK